MASVGRRDPVQTRKSGAAARSLPTPSSARLVQLAAALNAGASVQRLAARERSLNLPSGGSSAALPAQLRAGLEQLSGVDLSPVRVHRNSPAPAQLQAHAYTRGSDIHLGPGGERHLPHEAWHVVQQAQGRVRPTAQLAGDVAINDSSALEREADVMGARAAQLLSSGGAEAPTTPLDSGEDVVQGRFTANQFAGMLQAPADPALAEIQRHVADFDRLAPRLSRHHQQRLLLRLQNEAQQWLVANIRSPNRDAVLDLLDEVQDDYIQVVDQVVLNNEDLFVGDQDQNNRAGIQQLWQTVVANNSQLRIDGNDPATGHLSLGFTSRIRASLAQMLQTPSGREFLGELQQGPAQTSIVPLTGQGRALLGQLSAQLGGPGDAGQSPGVTLGDFRPAVQHGVLNQQRAQQIRGAQSRNMGVDRQVRNNLMVPMPNGGFDTLGTGAIVAIDPTLRNSTGFALDTTGSPLVTPEFLTLHHELNHAQRITRGQSMRGINPQLVNEPRMAFYPNFEELEAIDRDVHSENAERAARGLGVRLGHAGGLRNQLPAPLNPQGMQLVPFVPPAPQQQQQQQQLVPYVPPAPQQQQLALPAPPLNPQDMQLVPYVPPPPQQQQQPLALPAPPQQQQLALPAPPLNPQDMQLVPYVPPPPQQQLALPAPPQQQPLALPAPPLNPEDMQLVPYVPPNV